MSFGTARVASRASRMAMNSSRVRPARWMLCARSSATVVSHGRGPKVRIFKMRRRKHYMKTQGHRQNYTEIRVDAINE